MDLSMLPWQHKSDFPFQGLQKNIFVVAIKFFGVISKCIWEAMWFGVGSADTKTDNLSQHETLADADNICTIAGSLDFSDTLSQVHK